MSLKSLPEEKTNRDLIINSLEIGDKIMYNNFSHNGEQQQEAIVAGPLDTDEESEFFGTLELVDLVDLAESKKAHATNQGKVTKAVPKPRQPYLSALVGGGMSSAKKKKRRSSKKRRLSKKRRSSKKRRQSKKRRRTKRR